MITKEGIRTKMTALARVCQLHHDDVKSGKMIEPREFQGYVLMQLKEIEEAVAALTE